MQIWGLARAAGLRPANAARATMRTGSVRTAQPSQVARAAANRWGALKFPRAGYCVALVPPFNSLYTHGLARVAAGVPHLRPAEPRFNAERTIALARRAAEEDAAVVVFPELGLSAYAIDDLLHQEALTAAVE